MYGSVCAEYRQVPEEAREWLLATWCGDRNQTGASGTAPPQGQQMPETFFFSVGFFPTPPSEKTNSFYNFYKRYN